MLKEGYLEKDVVPIAAKKAKDRYRALSKEEIESTRRRELRTIPYSNNGKNRGG